MSQKSLFGSLLRAGVHRQISRHHGLGSSQQFHSISQLPQNYNASGAMKNFKVETHLESSIFRRYIHSGKQAENEAGSTPRSMDYVQGLLQDRGTTIYGRAPLPSPQIETNADIVHIKLMRNNAFVTVTDSKGNKKTGVSAGKLAGRAGKLTRYSADAAAEEIGRKVRQMKTRSVVVKVNGFTFFKKKKDAILSFKDGYSNSRGDVHPVVYIEDTTRKPHNGCRLPKKRRI